MTVILKNQVHLEMLQSVNSWKLSTHDSFCLHCYNCYSLSTVSQRITLTRHCEWHGKPFTHLILHGQEEFCIACRCHNLLHDKHICLHLTHLFCNTHTGVPKHWICKQNLQKVFHLMWSFIFNEKLWSLVFQITFSLVMVDEARLSLNVFSLSDLSF